MKYDINMREHELLELVNMSKNEELNNTNELLQNHLHEAIANGKSKFAIELINSGIFNLEQKDHQGRTALHYAAEYNNIEVVTSLLAKGADPNVQNQFGNTPLWSSLFSAKGSYNLFLLLIKKDANPDIKNNKGESTRDVAIKTGKTLATAIINENEKI